MSAATVIGDGRPVTVVLSGPPGLSPDIRPFAAGLTGTRWELVASGSSTERTVDVVRTSGASRAIAVSVAVPTLLAGAAQLPDQLHRLVLALPPAPADDPIAATRLRAVTDAVAAADQVAVGRALLAMQPATERARPATRIRARRQAAELLARPSSDVLASLQSWSAPPQPAPHIDASVLVLAQRDDPMHPLNVARALVDERTDATLLVSDSPWSSDRARLRDVVTAFLDG